MTPDDRGFSDTDDERNTCEIFVEANVSRTKKTLNHGLRLRFLLPFQMHFSVTTDTLRELHSHSTPRSAAGSSVSTSLGMYWCAHRPLCATGTVINMRITAIIIITTAKNNYVHLILLSFFLNAVHVLPLSLYSTHH